MLEVDDKTAYKTKLKPKKDVSVKCLKCAQKIEFKIKGKYESVIFICPNCGRNYLLTKQEIEKL